MYFSALQSELLWLHFGDLFLMENTTIQINSLTNTILGFFCRFPHNCMIIHNYVELYPRIFSHLPYRSIENMRHCDVSRDHLLQVVVYLHALNKCRYFVCIAFNQRTTDMSVIYQRTPKYIRIYYEISDQSD